MLNKILVSLVLSLISNPIFAQGYDVFSIGVYDVKLDGSQTDTAADFKYERRFDSSFFDIGPESENFFFLKPFVGLELTSDSATYLIGGFYLEDNIGMLLTGNESNFNFTPSFGAGYYNKGDGKTLGNEIEFRTTFEISYQLKNFDRIGFSIAHISNANLGDKNPGVEVLSISYQVPFN
jgi:lipid A 3-O-deacylase